MRLPWVSRDHFDAVVSLAATAQTTLDREQRRFNVLLEKYHELSLHVTTQPVYIPPVVNPLLPTSAGGPPAPERVPSVVAQAIKDESQGDPKLARVLWKRARELRQENHSPEEIAKEIRRWETTEVEDK